MQFKAGQYWHVTYKGSVVWHLVVVGLHDSSNSWTVYGCRIFNDALTESTWALEHNFMTAAFDPGKSVYIWELIADV